MWVVETRDRSLLRSIFARDPIGAIYMLGDLEDRAFAHCRFWTAGDQAVVLFAIVRVTRALLAPEIRDAIEAERIPLGRILIRSELLRHVRLLSLWKVEPGEELCRIFRFAEPRTCFGRTALMYCDTVPIIELLEIVTAD